MKNTDTLKPELYKTKYLRELSKSKISTYRYVQLQYCASVLMLNVYFNHFVFSKVGEFIGQVLCIIERHSYCSNCLQ